MIIFDESKFCMESLGEIIKRTLREKGIKESFVAQKMNVSKQVINQIDRRKHFDNEFLTNLEKATGIDFTQHIPVPDHIRKSIESIGLNKNIEINVNKNVDHNNEKGIPMYNAPGAGGGVEVYTDSDSAKVIGYLNFPGITKGSFALQVFGSSMEPTLGNGIWTVLRPITSKQDIAWGEVYYVEWSDFRMFKRVLLSDVVDEIILWSDNQHELINGRPVFSPIHVKKENIRSISLVTDTYKKASN